MTVHGVRFEGPAASALKIATALADADGIDLLSSEPASKLDDGLVRLDVQVEGTRDAVTAALEWIGNGLPDGASITAIDP
jgi:hypothetical protein